MGTQDCEGVRVYVLVCVRVSECTHMTMPGGSCNPGGKGRGGIPGTPVPGD